MRKYHKTDWTSKTRIPVNIIKSSDLYPIEAKKYQRNLEKRNFSKEIKRGLEGLGLDDYKI